MSPYLLVRPQGLKARLGPPHRTARAAAAAALHATSRALAALAHRLAHAPRAATPAAAPQLEFHAEAGAPEGALYADGVLVALLPGVNRL